MTADTSVREARRVAPGSYPATLSLRGILSRLVIFRETADIDDVGSLENITTVANIADIGPTTFRTPVMIALSIQVGHTFSHRHNEISVQLSILISKSGGTTCVTLLV